jgi:hypothetical protein
MSEADVDLLIALLRGGPVHYLPIGRSHEPVPVVGVFRKATPKGNTPFVVLKHPPPCGEIEVDARHVKLSDFVRFERFGRSA